MKALDEDDIALLKTYGLGPYAQRIKVSLTRVMGTGRRAWPSVAPRHNLCPFGASPLARQSLQMNDVLSVQLKTRMRRLV